MRRYLLSALRSDNKLRHIQSEARIRRVDFYLVNPLPPLDPAVAATRLAVRRVLQEVRVRQGLGGNPPKNATPESARTPTPTSDPLVLVALSGGADSLALAAALAFEAPKAGVRAGAVVVDHGLQSGSAAVAEQAAGQARDLGLEPVQVRRVNVSEFTGSTHSGGGSGGPEAAAREARYAAIEQVRADTQAEIVLTAHTRDDQAEQVLLALARGSGTRALAGIPPARDHLRRPFLGIDRATTVGACHAQHLQPWIDPHNQDPTYTRVRVRERVIPVLSRELGPGISASLARSAELAREDADALDELAVDLLARTLEHTDERGFTLPVSALAEAPAALRQRVIRFAARDQLGSHLSREHTRAIAALITDWRGQGAIHVPSITVTRRNQSLIFEPHS